MSGMPSVDAIQRGEPPANPTRILHAYVASDNPPAYTPAALPTLAPAILPTTKVPVPARKRAPRR